MSRNPCDPEPRIDRRVQRTRDRLGDALVALIQERPFDSITVQDVLDRAGVGRSTFYQHYRDKHDLFVSDVDEFLEAMASHLVRTQERSERIAPVRELFAHVGEQQRLYEALVASGKIHDFLDLARAHFARAIEQRLAQIPRAHGVDVTRRAVAARAHAAALLELLHWWLGRGRREPPAQMDAIFHDLVWSGLAPALAAQRTG